MFEARMLFTMPTEHRILFSPSVKHRMIFCTLFGQASRCYLPMNTPTTHRVARYQITRYNFGLFTRTSAATKPDILAMSPSNMPKHSQTSKNLSRQISEGWHYRAPLFLGNLPPSSTWAFNFCNSMRAGLPGSVA
jgi:hypothetical protein